MVYLDQNAAMLHRHVEVYLVRGLICGNYKTASDWSSLCHDVFRPITSIVSLLIALGDSSGSYKQHESLLAVDCSFLFHELYKECKLISNRYDMVLKPLSQFIYQCCTESAVCFVFSL